MFNLEIISRKLFHCGEQIYHRPNVSALCHTNDYNKSVLQFSNFSRNFIGGHSSGGQSILTVLA